MTTGAPATADGKLNVAFSRVTCHWTMPGAHLTPQVTGRASGPVD